MAFGKTMIISAALSLAIASVSPAVSQSTRNVGGNTQNNIGGNNIGGGGNNLECINVTLAGATRVRACQNGYTAKLGNIFCSGGVSLGNAPGVVRLFQGPCNQAGQRFLGGTLACFSTSCEWRPSAAGRAQGFQSEYVSVYYN